MASTKPRQHYLANYATGNKKVFYSAIVPKGTAQKTGTQLGYGALVSVYPISETEAENIQKSKIEPVQKIADTIVDEVLDNQLQHFSEEAIALTEKTQEFLYLFHDIVNDKTSFYDEELLRHAAERIRRSIQSAEAKIDEIIKNLGGE